MPPESQPSGPPRNWRRGFWSLIVTQFQGAFSDNAQKNLVILLILGAGLPQAEKDRLVPYVLVLFAVPFILFSMAGGYLADRYSKRSAAIGTKCFEIVVMCVAVIGLARGNLALELSAIFLMNTVQAIFGPTKYGLLPEILPLEKLSWGNGILELGTFVAILTGTVAAGFMSEDFHGRQIWSGAILVALAIFGTLASLGITRVPAADPQKKFRANFVGDLWAEMKIARRDRVLWIAVLANTYFWFLGGLLQPIILLYGKEVLLLGDKQNTYLQAALAIGIGIGSLAAGYLSRGKIEYGLIPAGAIGLTIFAASLATPGISFLGVAILLGFVGLFAGFFAVPVLALIQHRPSPERKGSMQAAANLLSFVGVFLAAGAYRALVTDLHLTPSEVFLVGSGLTLLATIYVCVALPECVARMKAWVGATS
ncbi:MAG: MFS transporter [Candidatus Acidiferrales bacterium]